jgi:hypothetical protein
MTDTPAPDLVKLLLFRSSDEAGIGWTPTTVVHVPAGLLHNAADTITALCAEIERLRAALRGVYEVYAGSDGFIPETAAEGYQQQIIKQMVDIISAALKEPRT